jgi:hypothetical protein
VRIRSKSHKEKSINAKGIKRSPTITITVTARTREHNKGVVDYCIPKILN